MFKLCRGFNLAELLIVLAILGVISAFTIPKIMDTSSSEARYTKAQEMAAIAVAITRQYRLTTGSCFAGVTCKFNPSTGASLDGLPLQSYGGNNPAGYMQLVAFTDQRLSYLKRAQTGGMWGDEYCYELHSLGVLCPSRIGLYNYNGLWEVTAEWLMFIEEPLEDIPGWDVSSGGVDADVAQVFILRNGKVIIGSNNHRISRGLAYNALSSSIFDIKDHPADTCATVGGTKCGF